MKNIKINHKLKIVIPAIITMVLSLILYTRSDFRDTFISGDAEPDYLANAYNIIKNGKPIGFHHPGTIHYYILAITIYVINLFTYKINTVIILSRLIYWILLLCIFIYSLIKAKKKLAQQDIIIKYLTCILLFVSIPELKELVFKMSAEALLFPLSIIFYLSLNGKNIHKISIVFGILISLKFTSIILAPIIYNKIKRENTVTKIRAILLILSTYFVTTYPASRSFISPLLPLYQTGIRIYTTLIDLLKYNSIFIIGIIIILIALTLIIIKNKAYKLLVDNYVKILSVSIIILALLSNKSQYFRHFVPVLIIGIFNYKIRLNHLYNKLVLSFTAIICFVIFNKNINRELSVDEYIKKQNSNCYIFQDSSFNSEILFLKWSEYRYGNSNQIIPNEYFKALGLNSEKVKYLNTRFSIEQNNKFNAELIASSTSFNVPISNQINDIINNKLQIIIPNPQNSSFLNQIIPILKKYNVRSKLMKKYHNNNFISYTITKTKEPIKL